MRENYNYSCKNNNINNVDFDSIFNSFKGNIDSNDFINDQNESDETSSNNVFGNFDIGTILKMKSVMDKMNNSKDDPRSNLLRSLKPYLSSNKRTQVDKYIQFFSIAKAFECMNNLGGENKNDV